jgi:hypothetical protein
MIIYKEILKMDEEEKVRCSKCGSEVDCCDYCGAPLYGDEILFCLDEGYHLCSERCLLDYYKDYCEGYTACEVEVYE